MPEKITQVGGTHYDTGSRPQHWDLVVMYQWDYFQAQVFKYLMRWKDKHPTPEKKLEDLKKARSFLDKYILEYEKFLPNVLSPAQEQMKSDLLGPNPDRLYMWRDDIFTCEGWRGELALFKHNVTKVEYWAKNLGDAYRMHDEATKDAGAEPSGAYVGQG